MVVTLAAPSDAIPTVPSRFDYEFGNPIRATECRELWCQQAAQDGESKIAARDYCCFLCATSPHQ